MSVPAALRRTLQVSLGIAIFTWLGAVQGAIGVSDLNPAAITITPPKDIKWVEGNGGSATATLAGDPSKPGIYVQLNKWHPHRNSRPHSHPNDRYITVLSGTWWVATGTDYDLNKMVPVAAGSYVKHTGGQVHWDGAKDEECVLEIVGMGPATSTSAEKK
jgi:hypothetical protein